MHFDPKLEAQINTNNSPPLLAMCISVSVTSDYRAAASAPTALCYTLWRQIYPFILFVSHIGLQIIIFLMN